jgi:hypothetical protein
VALVLEYPIGVEREPLPEIDDPTEGHHEDPDNRDAGNHPADYGPDVVEHYIPKG